MNNIHVTVVYLLVSYILVKQMYTMFIILTVHIAYFTYFKPMFKLSIDFVTWIIPVYAFKSAFYSFVLYTITCSARTLLFLNIYFNWIKRLNLAVHGQIQISSGRYTQAKKKHTNTLFLKHGLWIIESNIRKLCQSKYESDTIWECRSTVT